MESILTSVKKSLGIPEEYVHFDQDLITHINSVFSILTQMGVGPTNGFSIASAAAAWDAFIVDAGVMPLVKSYMVLKVRLMFDPPQSSAVMECLKSQISEYEWRLNVSGN